MQRQTDFYPSGGVAIASAAILEEKPMVAEREEENGENS